MRLRILVLTLFLAACGQPPSEQSAADRVAAFERFEGFVDMYWDESGGRLYLATKDGRVACWGK